MSTIQPSQHILHYQVCDPASIKAIELQKVRIEPKRIDSNVNDTKQIAEDLIWMDTINQEESIVVRHENIYLENGHMETLQKAWPHTYKCAVDTAGTNSTVVRSSSHLHNNGTTQQIGRPISPDSTAQAIAMQDSILGGPNTTTDGVKNESKILLAKTNVPKANG